MTALVVPLIYSNATLDPVLLPRFLTVSVVAIVTAFGFALHIVRSSSAVDVNRAERTVLAFLLAYILVAAASVTIAGRTPDGTFELMKTSIVALLIFTASRAIRGRRGNLALLAKLVVLSSLLVGATGIFQHYGLTLPPWMEHHRALDSTLANPNLLASFLLLAFPFVLYCVLELPGLWRVLSVLAMLTSLFLFVTLQSRAVWVALPLGIAASLLVRAAATRQARITDESRHVYRRRVIWTTAVAAFGLAIALLLQSPGSRAAILDHVRSLADLQHPSVRERLELWARSMAMLADHPVTGVGLGNWRVMIPAYGMEGLRSETGILHFQRPHNDFLWVASETGLFGALLYIAVFAAALTLIGKAMARTSDVHDRVVLTLMFFGISCYVLVSLFSFPKERVAHSIYLALTLGAALSFYREAPNRRPPVSIPRSWTIVIVALMVGTTVLTGRFAIYRLDGEIQMRRALIARATNDWQAMAASIDRVDTRYYAMDPTGAPVAWYRGVAHFEMGETRAALSDFRRAAAVHPNHVHVLNNLATCHARLGEYSEAIELYERVLEMAPRFQEPRINLGFLLHALGRDQDAFEVLEPALGYADSERFRDCLRRVKAAIEASTQQ